jgi:hypothetical protein
MMYKGNALTSALWNKMCSELRDPFTKKDVAALIVTMGYKAKTAQDYAQAMVNHWRDEQGGGLVVAGPRLYRFHGPQDD